MARLPISAVRFLTGYRITVPGSVALRGLVGNANWRTPGLSDKVASFRSVLFVFFLPCIGRKEGLSGTDALLLCCLWCSEWGVSVPF